MEKVIELENEVTPGRVREFLRLLILGMKLALLYALIEGALIGYDYLQARLEAFKSAELRKMLVADIAALNLAPLDPKTGLPKEKIELVSALKAAVFYKRRADVCAGHIEEVGEVIAQEMDIEH